MIAARPPISTPTSAATPAATVMGTWKRHQCRATPNKVAQALAVKTSGACLPHQGAHIVAVGESENKWAIPMKMLQANITKSIMEGKAMRCLLYTSDAADDLLCVDL